MPNEDTKEEVERLRKTVTEFLEKKPEKGAQILSFWLRNF